MATAKAASTVTIEDLCKEIGIDAEAAKAALGKLRDPKVGIADSQFNRWVDENFGGKERQFFFALGKAWSV